MRLLVVLALLCVVGVYAYPMGGGGYYGAGSGMDSGYGGQGYLQGGGANSGAFGNANDNFRRIEEGSSSSAFGNHNNMGGLNQGGGNYGYNRGGSNMHGGGMGGLGPVGPIGMPMGGLVG